MINLENIVQNEKNFPTRHKIFGIAFWMTLFHEMSKTGKYISRTDYSCQRLDSWRGKKVLQWFVIPKFGRGNKRPAFCYVAGSKSVWDPGDFTSKTKRLGVVVDL